MWFFDDTFSTVGFLCKKSTPPHRQSLVQNFSEHYSDSPEETTLLDTIHSHLQDEVIFNSPGGEESSEGDKSHHSIVDAESQDEVDPSPDTLPPSPRKSIDLPPNGELSDSEGVSFG